MIRIRKPPAPEKLRQDGQAETVRNYRLYDEGTRKFEFKSSIYGDTTVKEALRQAQHGKCCFCERKEEIGDVEHFRPKSGYQQNVQDKLNRPGYYWLAYEWDNLFFCCPKCNRSYKRNFFPLADESKRARSHHDDISAEEPLLVHPAHDNPEEFIEYVGSRPRAIGNNRKGRLTISRTGLDRPFLDERRFEKYQVCKQIYQTAHTPGLDAQIQTKLRNLLDEYAQEHAEFSTMIRCALKQGFRY